MDTVDYQISLTRDPTESIKNIKFITDQDFFQTELINAVKTELACGRCVPVQGKLISYFDK